MKGKKSIALMAGLICMVTSLIPQYAVRGDEGRNGPTLRLTRSGLHRAALCRSDQAGVLSLFNEDVPDTVVAIRVDFPEDTTGTTTGTGKFDLSSGSQETINPPPHHRAYFERQLEALRRYYRNVSRGQLDISYAIYPQESQGAYTLPQEMAYYSPNLTEEENDRRLAEFFRDALETADQVDTIDFSRYDAVVIFHAGVGADIAFAVDETPNDIPSAYMDLEWLVGSLGSQYAQGVPVNGGSHHIQEGLWMPETLNQQDVEFGLTGLLALLFGHQLGLPNLYNSQDGSSGIGTWGLMDQGSGNELGLIPAQPCAWSRVFLGWERPVLVRDSLNVAVDALVTGGDHASVLKVPINADEYFLIENRQQDVFGDGSVAVSDGGVVIEIDEYDWGIPGSGLLIWHIDEQVIRENYESNTINTDPYHRGVDLEEADGFQDIGFIIYGGYVTYGFPEDAFYQGNNTAFTPHTNPSSESYTGANSHIFVTDIGPSGPTMTCDVSMDLHQPGWPDSVGVSLAENPPLVGDLDGDGDLEVVINSVDGRVFAWNHDGTPYLSGDDGSALFAQLADSIVGSAVLGDVDGDGDLEIVAGTQNGSVHCWQHDGAELTGFPYDLQETMSCAPVVASVPEFLSEDQIIVATADGLAHALFLEGESVESVRVNLETSGITTLTVIEGDAQPYVFWVFAGTVDDKVVRFSPFGERPIIPNAVQTSSEVRGLAIGDIDRDDVVEIIALSEGVEVNSFDVWFNHQISEWSAEVDGVLESPPVLGDFDDDGYLEVMVVGINQIWAWNYNGSVVTNFPLSLGSMGPLKSSPILGDVDGDGHIDIVVGTSQGLMVAYDRFGQPLDGWPLACAGAIETSPALADVDGDGDIELLVADAVGWMYVWDLASEPDPEQLPWPTWRHDVRHTGAYPGDELPPMPQAGDLMPAASVYNYPNPTEGQGTTIRYTLGREAHVDIRIYDLSGDLVAEFPGTGFAHTENEVFWDLTAVASGIYLCRVQARSSGGEETTFCKIAVVK